MNNNSDKIKISVVVPVYKVEKYLQDCIDSLLNQTFGSIEFIFVDDASPDRCGGILDRNAAKHPDKIKVIHLPENRCLGGARNAGIAASQGEYIGFVDSDDMILPEMYEVLYNSVTESGSDVSFIKTSRISADKTYSEVLDNCRNKTEFTVYRPLTDEMRRFNEIDDLKPEDKELLYVTHFTGGVWSGLWRKSLITDNNVFFPEHICFEDRYWCGLIITYLSRLRFVDSVQYLYRENPDSIVNRSDLKSKRDKITSDKLKFAELKARGLFDLYKNGLEYFSILYYARNAFDSSILRCRGYFRIRKFLKQTMEEFRTEFPDWKNNRYYIQRTGDTEKARDEKIINFSRKYYFVSYFRSKIRKRKLLSKAFNKVLDLYVRIKK